MNIEKGAKKGGEIPDNNYSLGQEDNRGRLAREIESFSTEANRLAGQPPTGAGSLDTENSEFSQDNWRDGQEPNQGLVVHGKTNQQPDPSPDMVQCTPNNDQSTSTSNPGAKMSTPTALTHPNHVKVTSNPMGSNLKANLFAHFPSRLSKPVKEDVEKDMWEMFRKVQVNIPLVDAIK